MCEPTTDFDLFKSINDAFGHQAGDELLVAVADRLTGVLRPGDTLARLGGDEFVILCEDLEEASTVELLAARISVALAEPFGLSGTDVQVSASVGIAFAGPGAELSKNLLQEADEAMYRAKREGGSRHQIVDLREQRLAAPQTRDRGAAPRLGASPGQQGVGSQVRSTAPGSATAEPYSTPSPRGTVKPET
ncbi:MAG: diguanylate cyclase domain-containing protein [Acidimicrobiales bacterium]